MAGVGAAFAATRDVTKPLIIGSVRTSWTRETAKCFFFVREGQAPNVCFIQIKSNVGHAEPAAGLSGLIKTILSLEHGRIPGTPLYINPNPNINFSEAKVQVSRTILPWPATDGKPRRASINSFGYGGANGHAILEESHAHTQGRSNHVVSLRPVEEAMQWTPEDPDYDTTGGGGGGHAAASTTRPYTLALSANDAVSLSANIAALCSHFANPRVSVPLRDVAYTLSQRRSHLWHRAFVTVHDSDSNNKFLSQITLQPPNFTQAKRHPRPPRIALIFTGQGAQWPQMGQTLLHVFPTTIRRILTQLDTALQGLTACAPPTWSLLAELTEQRDAEHLRQPELAQPLATALQICLVGVLREVWGVQVEGVVGHSSGEIAAAYVAGRLDAEGAIKAAFFRGRAVAEAGRNGRLEGLLGMLAVGLGEEGVVPYLGGYGGRVSIACFNSPNSVTISGRKDDLEALEGELKAAGHFARLLQVDVAYHSWYMGAVGEEYESLMNREGFQLQRPSGDLVSGKGVRMFSSVTTSQITDQTPMDTSYWKSNLLSPVHFDKAVQEMLSQPDRKSPDILIEVGPSGALAGPVSQILKSLPGAEEVSYHTAWSRGPDAIKALFNLAGQLFITGAAIDMGAVNNDEEYKNELRGINNNNNNSPRCVVDLPSYRWNHSAKYWYESAASRDWRFRRFVTHDLIGSKILGTPWSSPIWRKRLLLNDLPWLRHHKMGGDVLMPGAGFWAMALEAMYQKHCALELQASPQEVRVSDLAYGLRNVRFHRALVVPEGEPVHIFVSLTKLARSSDDSGWHEVRISTSKDDVVFDHCSGLIRVQEAVEEGLAEDDKRRAPLRAPQPFSSWYKTQREVGMDFGPAFQKIESVEASSGERSCRAMVDMTPPSSAWDPQSHYSLHPALLDAFLQTLMPPNAANERSLVAEIQIPGLANEAFVNRIPRHQIRQGLVLAQSRYSGRGRPEQAKGIIGDVSSYDAESGALLMKLKGLNYVKLDANPRTDPHIFDSVQWKPDITLLTQAHLEIAGIGLDAVLDLVAHKRPQLKVLEINLTNGGDGPVSSLWLGAGDVAARQACHQYDFACSDAETLVTARRQFAAHTKHNAVAYLLASPKRPIFGFETATLPRYDLAILQLPQNTANSAEKAAMCKNLEPLLANGGFTVMAQPPKAPESAPPSSIASTGSRTPSIDDETSSGVDVGASQSGGEQHSASSTTSLTNDDAKLPTAITSPSGTGRHLDRVLTIDDGAVTHHICKVSEADHELDSTGCHEDTSEPTTSTPRPRTLIVTHLFSPSAHQTAHLTALLDRVVSITSAEAQTPWVISHVPSALALSTLPAPCPNDNSIILLPDEIYTSVLVDPSPEQWSALQALLATGRPLLWLTSGGGGTQPERAMAHGLLRVVRRELAGQGDEALRVVLDIDVDGNGGGAEGAAVGSGDWNVDDALLAGGLAAVLGVMGGTTRVSSGSEGRGRAELEYRLGRDGILAVPRLVPDAPVNEFCRPQLLDEGGAAVVAGLWETERVVRLRGERVGSLDLAWCECVDEPLQEGFVEVEVEAVGVNFKVS